MYLYGLRRNYCETNIQNKVITDIRRRICPFLNTQYRRAPRFCSFIILLFLLTPILLHFWVKDKPLFFCVFELFSRIISDSVFFPFYSTDDDICSDETDDNNEPVCLGTGDNNSILTPFLISSAFIATVFISIILLYIVNITENIKKENQEYVDERIGDSLGDLGQFFIPFFFYSISFIETHL